MLSQHATAAYTTNWQSLKRSPVHTLFHILRPKSSLGVLIVCTKIEVRSLIALCSVMPQRFSIIASTIAGAKRAISISLFRISGKEIFHRADVLIRNYITTAKNISLWVLISKEIIFP